MNFHFLQQQYHNCTKCPKLCQSRSQVVFGNGNPNAKILFIGESPGVTEDKQGIPFCGMSGQILQQLLATINLTREDIFITNTILCHPENNRNPEQEEVNNCRERLDQLIQVIQPKVIVTIGNFATERILNKKGITQLRGKVHPAIINNQEISVIPIIHPANYLYNGRNPEMFKQMTSDFQLINSVIQKQNKQKNLTDF
ncbi:uracil-DNA glycosylase [Candidatus Woesearchaeota archaeon]|nr:uracil-DNA glycosylase [Candidatus Woesearchaeota archaeon]